MHPCSRVLLLKTISVSVSSAVPGPDNCTAPCPSARIHLSCQGGMRRTVTLATALTGDLLRAAYNTRNMSPGAGKLYGDVFVGFAFQPEQPFQ